MGFEGVLIWGWTPVVYPLVAIVDFVRVEGFGVGENGDTERRSGGLRALAVSSPSKQTVVVVGSQPETDGHLAAQERVVLNSGSKDSLEITY